MLILVSIMNKMMKVKLIELILFLYTSITYSQLYVGSNEYLFVKNEILFVKNDIDLQTNGYVYLRNEGQLLQGTNGLSNNKGLGKLSVFQEGTSDNFDYNYWCSPVGNASSNIGNENFGISMFHVPISSTASNPANIYLYNYNGITSNGNLSIAAYWIWRYLSGSNYSEWIQSGANSNIEAGQGFTMKGTAGTDNINVGENTVNNPGSAQRYDFRGKPNDGNITVTVGADKFTLTGNPYPSALHLNEFLLDPSNSDCTGVAYFWEQNRNINSHYLTSYQGGYGTYSPISTSLTEYGVYVPATFNTYNADGTINTSAAYPSGLIIERKYIPIGQGFMIKGNSTVTPTSVTLKNSHRYFHKESDGYSQFERGIANQHNQSNIENNPTNENITVIRLNVILNNQFTKPLALVLSPNATDGIDRGIDALSPVEETVPNDVYFLINQKKYVIQGVSFDVNKRIPLGIKANNASTFKFDSTITSNLNESQVIYLYDAFDNSYHDIKNGYYEVSLSAGVYNNRFEITFDNQLLSNNTSLSAEFTILQNHSTNTVEILNPNGLDIKSIKLYDLSGKKVLEKHRIGTQTTYQMETLGFSNGTYLIEINSTNNLKTIKKIIIRH